MRYTTGWTFIPVLEGIGARSEGLKIEILRTPIAIRGLELCMFQ
jgi:hypothetical protein